MLEILPCFSKCFSSKVIKVGQYLHPKNGITRNETELNTSFNFTAKLRTIFFMFLTHQKGASHPQGTHVNQVKNICCKTNAP
jgi:hypothetical protein